MGTERQREEFKRRAALETGIMAAAQQAAVWKDDGTGRGTSGKQQQH